MIYNHRKKSFSNANFQRTAPKKNPYRRRRRAERRARTDAGFGAEEAPAGGRAGILRTASGRRRGESADAAESGNAESWDADAAGNAAESGDAVAGDAAESGAKESGNASAVFSAAARCLSAKASRCQSGESRRSAANA